MKNFKLVKSAAALALGASVITSAVVVPSDASAASKYKIKSGKLVVAKTGKVVKGYVTFNKLVYKDGKKLTGLKSSVYYKAGKKATGIYKSAYYVNGAKKVTTGTYNKAYYVKGVRVVTTGLYKDLYYLEGKKATGTYKSAYYVNGAKKVTTGTYAGAYYVSGKKVVTTGLYKEQLYTKGALSKGLVVFDGKLYKDAVLNTGLVLFKEKLYDGAELNKGIKEFDGKFYNNEVIADGTFEVEGKEEAFEKGLKVGSKVKTVEALTLNTAKITFNKTTDAVAVTDLTVSNKASGEKLVVKAVKLSADKKSATVEFYSEVVANATYTVAAQIGEQASTTELAVGTLAPATIAVPNQTINNLNNSVQYVVKDANGIDITSNYPGAAKEVEFVSPSGLVSANGTVTLTNGISTTVKVVIKDATNKVIAESNTATLTAEQIVATKISNWSVAPKASTISFDNATFKQNNVVTISTGTASDQKIHVEVKDQFNDVISGAKLQYESLNTDLAVVDKTTGTVTGFAAGVVPVKVSAVDNDGKVLTSTVIELKVQAVAKADSISVDKSAQTVSINDTKQAVKVTVKDQYGAAKEDEVVEFTIIKSTNTSIPAPVGPYKLNQTNDKGEVTLDLPQLPEGVYTIEFKVGDKTVTTTVTSKTPGVFSKYEVRNLEKTLDLNTDATAVQSTTPEVVSVDAAGLLIKEETGVITLLDKDGKSTSTIAKLDASGKTVTLNSTAKAGDKFTLVVTVDGKVIDSQLISVVDTTKDKVVSFTKYTINTKLSSTPETLEAVIASTILIDGKPLTSLTSIEYVASDSTLINSNGELVEGKNTIFISEVNGIKLPAIVKINLNVTK